MLFTRGYPVLGITFRTLAACMAAELRILFHEMEGMFVAVSSVLPGVFRHGWTPAEATGNIHEAIEGIDHHPRAEL